MKKVVIAAAITGLGIVGCGGGGGGANVTAAAAPTVTISASNQGKASRALTDGGQAFSSSQPFAAPGGAAAQSAVGSPVTQRTGVLPSMVREGLVAAFGSHRTATIASATRPAASASSSQACTVSGSISTTLNDADNSLSVSPGDSLQLTFDQCVESVGELTSGSLVFTVGSVTSAASGNVQFSGSVAFVQMTSTSTTQTTSVNGSVDVAATITSTSFQMALDVGSDGLTVTSSAPGYLDTIVYEAGTGLTVTATDGAVAESDVTLNGSFTASSIGGRVLVTTVRPLRQLGSDDYPSSGQVVLTGAAGTHLRVTALDATDVQLDLDANGDGIYETSGVFAWGSPGTI